MMSHLHVNLNSSKWNAGQENKNLLVQGSVFLENKLQTPDTLSLYLSALKSKFDLCTDLQQLNGFYAWVEHTPFKVRASVDHIRSLPLFYGQLNDNFYISDDAEWVRIQVGDIKMDAISREEFLLAGYVTGKDTLYPNVKQLQSGEYLIAQETPNGIHIETQRYYRFIHNEPQYYIESNLQHELNRATTCAMQRLIEYANGRQIVIPLSGGYDSRLLVSILKLLNYKNVLCFTYGLPENKESVFSKQVAEKLGFRWEFIEYSEQLWREEWNTPEAISYRKMASGHASLPHIQDWLAVKLLISNKIIDNDAIFVPGHSGDFVAGSHIPDFVFTSKKHTYESVIEAIINNHLSNRPKNNMELSDINLLTARITDRISLPFDGTDISFANNYEAWDCQERQAKYIVNSVRVYDQFSHDWWLPLWDLEFVKFWESVPLSLRKNRIWFKNWIQYQYANASGDADAINLQNAGEPTSRSVLDRLKKIIKIVTPKAFTEIMRRNNIKRFYKHHFLAFGGLISDEQLSEYSSKGYNIFGMYSDAYLNNKWQ